MSDPYLPYETGSIPITYNLELAINENHAYVIGGKRLTAIDISNPYLPRISGYINTNSTNSDLCIQNNYAYVACEEDGLKIYDISDPENMIEKGIYDTVNIAYSIDISGQFVYLADDEKIQVIDISDPESPFNFSSHDIPYFLWPKGIRINGNYAYLKVHFNGLVVLDISNPATIYEVGSYFPESRINSVSFKENKAYITSSDTGFVILDITDPSNIVSEGSINIRSYDAAINEDFAYVACNNYGFRILDIQNPEDPFETTWNYTPGDFFDVDIKDNYAYISAEDSGMRVVDISDKTKPHEVGVFKTSTRLYNIDIQGNYAYLPTMDSGLRVVDISDPENTFEIGNIDIEYAYDIEVRGDYGYLVNSWAHDFIILDLTTPENPVEISRYTNIAASSYDLVLQGNYAYLASDEYGLSIIDISDLQAPFEIGRYDNGIMSVSGVDVAGDYAYLATFIDLIVVDVSDPTNPIEVGTVPNIGALQVTIREEIAYVTGNHIGIKMFDISDPGNPVEIGYYTFGENPLTYGIDFLDEEIFISTHDDGMLIIHDWLITSTEEEKKKNKSNSVSVIPNPASNTTLFQFELEEDTDLSITIFNIHGQIASTLFEGHLPKGSHEFTFDAAQYSPGIYTYHLNAGNQSTAGKFIISK